MKKFFTSTPGIIILVLVALVVIGYFSGLFTTKAGIGGPNSSATGGTGTSSNWWQNLTTRIGICSDCVTDWQKQNCPNCKDEALKTYAAGGRMANTAQDKGTRMANNPKMIWHYWYNKTDDKYWIYKSSTNSFTDSVYVFDHADPVIPPFQNNTWQLFYKETNIYYWYAQNIKNVGQGTFEFDGGSPLLNKNNYHAGQSVTIDFFTSFKQHNYIKGIISNVQPSNANAIAIDTVLPHGNIMGATIFFD